MADPPAEPAPPRLLVAAAVLADPTGRLLVQRRPAGRAHAGLWEFPGGKVEPGETPPAALARELAEELGIAVAPADLAPLAFAEDGPVLLLLYRANRWRGEPVAAAADALAWTSLAEITALPMLPADLALVRQLLAGEARAGIEPACKDLQSSA